MPGSCGNCGSEDTVELTIFQRYAHIFWIPMFPIGKRASTLCNNCKQLLGYKELPLATRLLFKDLRQHSRTPVWMFSGLLLVAVLIPLAFWQDARFDKQLRAKLADPQVGDVYNIKLEVGSYTLFKVTQARADSVEIVVSEYETNKATAIHKLHSKGDDGYGEEHRVFSRQEILRMRDEGMIYGVDR